MTQYNFGTIDPNTTSGTTLAGYLNNWRDAVHSTHAGAARPSYAVTDMMWVKVVSSSAHELYLYDGADDVLIGTMNPTTNVWTPNNALVAANNLSDIASVGTALSNLKSPFRGFDSKTGNYTLQAADRGAIILCDATSGTLTISGLAAATAGAGYWIALKKIDSSANTVVFDPDGSETVDSAATFTMTAQFDIYFFESDGTNWRVVGGYRSNLASRSEAAAWTKPQRPQATDTNASATGTMTPNMADYQNFDWTLIGNITLANPTLTSAQVKQKGTIRLIQDGSGNHLLSSMGSYWKRVGTTGAPTLQTAASSIDCIYYEVVSTSRIEYSYGAAEA